MNMPYMETLYQASYMDAPTPKCACALPKCLGTICGTGRRGSDDHPNFPNNASNPPSISNSSTPSHSLQCLVTLCEL